MTPYRAPVPRRRATVLSVALIRERIVVVRGMRVMLDRDLAALYGVETKVLNQAVARNARRFPTDFSFRLTRATAKKYKVETWPLPNGRALIDVSHGGPDSKKELAKFQAVVQRLLDAGAHPRSESKTELAGACL